MLAQLVLFQIVGAGELFPATGVGAREGLGVAPMSSLVAAQIGDAREPLAAVRVLTAVRLFAWERVCEKDEGVGGGGGRAVENCRYMARLCSRRVLGRE